MMRTSVYSVVFFFLILTSCGYRQTDKVVFDNTTRISAVCAGDLDQNGMTDLALAVSEVGSRDTMAAAPISTSIFVFERKNGKFHYMWKSRPLLSVDSKMTVCGEEVREIRLSSGIHDPGMRVETADSVYSLVFDGLFFRLNETSFRPDKIFDEEEIRASFSGTFRAFKVISGKKRDYLFINFFDRKPDRIFVYKIINGSKTIFRPDGSIRTGPVTCFNVVRDPETSHSLLLAGTDDHQVKIFNLTGWK